MKQSHRYTVPFFAAVVRDVAILSVFIVTGAFLAGLAFNLVNPSSRSVVVNSLDISFTISGFITVAALNASRLWTRLVIVTVVTWLVFFACMSNGMTLWEWLLGLPNLLFLMIIGGFIGRAFRRRQRTDRRI